MNENEKIEVKRALSLLKAGYHLYTLINKKEEHFFYQKEKVLVRSEEKGLTLSPFSFLELYQDALFEIYDDEKEDYMKATSDSFLDSVILRNTGTDT